VKHLKLFKSYLKESRLSEESVESNDQFNLIEKNNDGTVSDDEEEREELLMARVEDTIDELLALIEREAEAIGGSFRSPGIKSRVAKLIKTKLQKAFRL
jgi:hypothetical protein